MNRRHFLKSALAASGSVYLPLSGRQTPILSPNDRLNIAYVGVGGQGVWSVQANTTENIIGFCDVDDLSAAETYSRYPKVPRFRDFRKLFDQLGSQIDAVVITTPDHTHYPIAMEAMRRGYHIYLEKPMAHTIAQIRNLQHAATYYKTITQLGIQGHSAEGLRITREWIEAGVIGKLIDVHFWTDRPYVRDFHAFESDAPAQTAPDTLDWDLWLGPARFRPYNERYTPARWRGWWDFGNGPLGDIGAHMWDVLEYCLNVGLPHSVSAENPRRSRVGTPRWSKVTYHYASTRQGNPLTVHWYNGLRDSIPHLPLNLPYWPEGREMPLDSGMYFVGEHGALFFPGMRAESAPLVFPNERWQQFRISLPPKTLPRVRGDHFSEFFSAIREDRPANAHFGYSAPLSEGVLLGNLAIKTGRSIYWDALQMKATGVPEADLFVHGPPPRQGWEYPLPI